uniref:Uncharacterized protein n=1 Tax=Amazona collaria TaxID=241587 RepID=A0A8B9F2S7_9PSIT
MEITIRQKCNYLMMKKFGRLVDFEAVQSYSVNIRVEELEVQIMEKEYEHSQELKEWEKRISDLQQQLMKLTKENTSKLQQLNRFCFEKHQLETKLAALKNDMVSLQPLQVWGCSDMGKGSVIWPSPALWSHILLCCQQLGLIFPPKTRNQSSKQKRWVLKRTHCP